MPDPISDLEAMQTSDAEQRLLNPRQAIAIDPRQEGVIPSTKGTLGGSL